MSTNTKIEWTNATWNPIRGCSKVSAGCEHCYAMHIAARFSGPGKPYEGLAKRDPVNWTGEVQVVEELLDEPLWWRKPRRVFVSSMSDLFHEGVPEELIARIFTSMLLARCHTFQVLTKRPARMAALFHDPIFRVAVGASYMSWPLPNVWLGVSVENQATADERIPLLLATPAAVRFVSCEPLLGPVDLTAFLPPDIDYEEDLPADERRDLPASLADWPGLDWVIVGGESGPGARPCNVQWVRDLVFQCREFGRPCFVKQLGSHPIGSYRERMEMAGETRQATGILDLVRWKLQDPKGGDPAEWPEDLQVREFPKTELAQRRGDTERA